MLAGSCAGRPAFLAEAALADGPTSTLRAHTSPFPPNHRRLTRPRLRLELLFPRSPFAASSTQMDSPAALPPSAGPSTEPPPRPPPAPLARDLANSPLMEVPSTSAISPPMRQQHQQQPRPLIAQSVLGPDGKEKQKEACVACRTTKVGLATPCSALARLPGSRPAHEYHLGPLELNRLDLPAPIRSNVTQCPKLRRRTIHASAACACRLSASVSLRLKKLCSATISKCEARC